MRLLKIQRRVDNTESKFIGLGPGLAAVTNLLVPHPHEISFSSSEISRQDVDLVVAAELLVDQDDVRKLVLYLGQLRCQFLGLEPPEGVALPGGDGVHLHDPAFEKGRRLEGQQRRRDRLGTLTLNVLVLSVLVVSIWTFSSVLSY